MSLTALIALLIRPRADNRLVVAYLSGPVEWRPIVEGSYGRWREVTKGQVLEPLCEVRTGSGGDVWLQVGDLVTSTLATPSSTTIVYWRAYPMPRLRLNTRFLPGTRMVQPIRGKISKLSIRGRLDGPN